MTKKEAFIQLLSLTDVQKNHELVDFINHEIALLDKRIKTKTSKVNEEHDKIKTVILENITSDGCTIKELQSKSEFLGGYSNQKLSAMLKKMVDDNILVRVKLKNATVFKLA